MFYPGGGGGINYPFGGGGMLLAGGAYPAGTFPGAGATLAFGSATGGSIF